MNPRLYNFSTFKLASLLSVLEDGYMKLSETVLEKGKSTSDFGFKVNALLNDSNDFSRS